jgi:hypothetical protein
MFIYVCIKIYIMLVSIMLVERVLSPYASRVGRIRAMRGALHKHM